MTENSPGADDSRDDAPHSGAAHPGAAQSGAAQPDAPQPGVPAAADPRPDLPRAEYSAAGDKGFGDKGFGDSTPPNPWSAVGAHGHENPSSQPQDRVLYGSAAPGGYRPPTTQLPTFPPPPPPRRSAGGLVAGVAVLALVVGGAAGGLGGYLVADNSSGSSNALSVPPPALQASTATPGSVEAVADKVLPSVVQIRTRNAGGSGFAISADGLIVTNNHVVQEAVQGGPLQVTFRDGQVAEATVIGRDPSSDLAVVKAKGVSGKVAATLGRSDDLKIGQAVVAIGSPFELSGTVTSGIVSSLNRPTRAGGEDGSEATVMDAIQTDAAINPGNSGGPLVNMAGQVIGINSAIYSPQGGSVGIGFAIPIDQARRTADEIVKTGKSTQTVVGVTVTTAQTGGAQIKEVVPGGAGEKAGLKAADVVLKVGDRRIETSDALVAVVRSKAPGDKVKLTLGDQRTVEVTLGGQQAPN